MRVFFRCVFYLLAALSLGCSQEHSKQSEEPQSSAITDTSLQVPAPDSCVMDVLIPESGQNRLQFVDGQLVVLNFLSGTIKTVRSKDIDTIKPVLPVDAYFNESGLFMGLGTTWLLTDSGIWDWPAQDLYRYDKPVRPMLNSSTLYHTSPQAELLFHTGYYSNKKLDAEGRKSYGQRSGLIAIKPNKKTRMAVVRELPIPIIPANWNDGNHYGTGAYYQLYDSLMVYSYQKYSRIFLYHLQAQSLVDSFDFPDLRHWGLEAAPERYTTNQRLKQLEHEPRYYPCFLANGYLVRLLRKKNQTWLMAINLWSRKLHVIEINTAKDHSIFRIGTFDNQLYQYRYEEMDDFTKLSLCVFDLPHFLQKAANR
jgi:hypothetical protein